MMTAAVPRRAALLALAVLLTAASPHTSVPLATIQSPPLPTLAAPGSTTFSAFAPAPVPDINADGVQKKSTPAQVEVTPGFFRPREDVSGDGFTPNSSIYSEQVKRQLPTPGLNLNVPLN